jgi:hypothetical protein
MLLGPYISYDISQKNSSAVLVSVLDLIHRLASGDLA